jgi:hypothetical protein
MIDGEGGGGHWTRDDAQGRWRKVHFGDRARGAKIGPSEDGGGGEVLERQAPGHVTTLMQDTLSDIISL